MPNTFRYFELLDHIGVEADGSLQPLKEEGLTLQVLSKVRGDQLVYKPKTVRLRPFAPKAHPRIIKTDDPVIAMLLLELSKYREVDPPESEQPRRPRRGRRTNQEA